MEKNEHIETVQKSREEILLEELIEVTKESGHYNRRFAYISFIFSFVAIGVASYSVIIAAKANSGNYAEFAVSGIVLFCIVFGIFYVGFKNPPWDETE